MDQQLRCAVCGCELEEEPDSAWYTQPSELRAGKLVLMIQFCNECGEKVKRLRESRGLPYLRGDL